jgi:hypothetical protein
MYLYRHPSHTLPVSAKSEEATVHSAETRGEGSRVDETNAYTKEEGEGRGVVDDEKEETNREEDSENEGDIDDGVQTRNEEDAEQGQEESDVDEKQDGLKNQSPKRGTRLTLADVASL